MRLIFAAITNLAFFFYTVKGETCPQEYLKITKDHTFCKPINASCKFLVRGIQSEQEKIDIVNIHNEYRNKVAMGKERLAGGMPTASNMLAFSWDDELSKIAQRLADQCIFDHDCNDCRAIASRSFSVGQNIAIRWYPCMGTCQSYPADWSSRIKRWYDEVGDFEKNIVKSMDNINRHPKKIGHFTQIIWAATHKIGCGYASFEENGKTRELYVCNYGPAGNYEGARVYLEGRPCSECPEKSCCGSSCKEREQKKFPGLCFLSNSQSIPPPSLTKNNTAPKPTKTNTPLKSFQNKPNVNIFCNFHRFNENCNFVLLGPGESRALESAEGTILRIEARYGSVVTVQFQKPIQVKEGNCIQISLRKGTIGAIMPDFSVVNVKYWSETQIDEAYLPNEPPFYLHKMPALQDGEVKLKVELHVAQGSPPQFLDIKEIRISEDACS